MKNNIDTPKTIVTRRLFIALPLPESAKEALATVLQDLPGRKVSQNKWHFTVVFLGDIEEDRLESLYQLFNEIRLPSAFELAITHMGAFPHSHAARVLWLGIEEENPALRSLNALFKDALSKANFAIEAGPFVPHLTVSRYSKAENIDNWLMQQSLPEIKITMHKVVLYQSIITKDKSYYQELLSRELL